MSSCGVFITTASIPEGKYNASCCIAGETETVLPEIWWIGPAKEQ